MTPADTAPAKRTRRLFVRLTEQERATLEKEAQSAGYTELSDFVRSRVLNDRRRRSPREAMARAASPGFVAMSPPLFAELTRIGNNLNQLARAFNSGLDVDRHKVMQMTARAWQLMLTDEVTARYVTIAETKSRGMAP